MDYMLADIGNGTMNTLVIKTEDLYQTRCLQISLAFTSV